MCSSLLSLLAVSLCMATSLQAETWTLQEAATVVARRFMADNPTPKRTCMGHCLLTRSPAESPLETSGSALIAAHIARALHHQTLEGDQYLAVARRVFAALPLYIQPDGTVLNTSPGPGPLETEEPWLKTDYPPVDPHGIFAVLHAASAERLLK